MDGSFSVSLKKKGKGKKKKTLNVFGNEDGMKDQNSDTTGLHISKKRKIRLTELTTEDLVSSNSDPQKPNERELIIKMEDRPNDEDGQPQEMTTLEEYESVPVELFGEALLRGMGWDGKNEDNEKKSNRSEEDVKKEMLKAKHPDNLGIGATATGVETDTVSFMPIKQVEKVFKEKTEEK
ncbi:pre-mRNA-splicing factor Spp2p [Monosporozyma servazzii]